MVKQVPFIDREPELALIDELIGESGTQGVLCLDGPGGIGKTRLLQEVRQRYIKAGEDAPLIVTDIIDFDVPVFHVPQNLGRHMALLLGEKNFEPYLGALLDWRQKEMVGFSPDRLTDEALAIDRVFIECFNKASAYRRVVLLVDTIEALEGTEVWNYVIRIGTQLQNTVLLIAGREAKKAGEALQAELGEVVQIHNLPPLSEQASEHYLRKKQDLLRIPLEPELTQKILFLAGGRPILIDLAVEWLAREAPLDWLVCNSLEKIRALSEDPLKDPQKMFERQLVEHIADTRRPIDWLILLMSRIYPLDVEMIAGLLAVPEEEAKALFEEARDYVFVKQLPNDRIMLHDEMRRLINEDVWPQVDPDGDRIRRDSKLAIEYLERKVQTLTKRIKQLEVEEKAARKEANAQAQLNAFLEREPLERELWMLKGLQLEHILFVDLDKGVKTFAEMFDEASQTHRFLRETLLAPMHQYAERLSPGQRYELDSRRVKYWLDEGQRQQAEQLATEILAGEDLSPEQQVDMLIQRGNLEIRLGHLGQGWSDLDRAVQISREHDLQNWLVRALNGRGWAYRVRGNFDRALADYLEAYQLSLQLNDSKRTAWILNNMAYVNAFKGNRTAAFKSCQAALRIWEEIDFPRGKGATYSTLGEISRWLDQLSEAMTYYTKALDIFTAEDDVEWISRVRCGRASVFRTRKELDKAQEDLDYAFEYGPLNIRPQIFYERAKISWLKNDLENSRQWFEECRKASQEIGETFYDYMSFADLLELAWEFGEYDRWREFADDHKRLYAGREDEESLRLRGSCLRKIADLAICGGEYEAALIAYREGLPLIAKYEVHERHTIEEIIEQIDERLHRCAPQSVFNRLGRDLAQLWTSKPELAMKYPVALSIFNRWGEEGQSSE